MKKIVILLLSILTFASCDDIKRKSVGAPFEMLVVCDDDLWNNPAGQALAQALRTPIPGLPQSEATFKIMRVQRDKFDTSNNALRNIILVDINSSHQKAELRFERDVYASPQIVMAINAPSKEEFGLYVSRNAQVIVDFFTIKERETQVAELEDKHNKQISSILKEVFDCDMKVPNNITGFKLGKDFMWISDYNNPARVEMLSFAVYSYPYNTLADLSREKIIHMRDSMMMMNIPGAEDGQYITTEESSVEITDATYNNRPMRVARGLWYMHNDDMFGGGPFVSHSIVDEINKRVIVAEAFVYAPNKKKGGFMRKLEASLYTLKLPGDFVKQKK